MALGSNNRYVTSADREAWNNGGGTPSWSSITGKPAAVTSLSGTNTGDQDLSGYALTSHNHTGVYQPVATGTPDGAKYLRDDNTWQPIVGGSGLSQAQARQLTRR